MSAAAIGSTSVARSTGSSSAFANLSSEQFMKILTTELANQDPFDPQDSSAMLEQLSSLRNIESQMSLQNRLESLVLQNQIANAGGMIGKLVTGRDGSNQSVSGIVTAVRVENGKAVLELDSGKSLAMERVLRMSSASADATAVTTGGTSGA